ncbi:FAD-dependent oxidoreductase [uncultured Paracoccus sp.]|uniref:NAD(P)/FAD-dependent oxidoreductase n=1 Tax=uncultured Paracoccus sp. TaxID=189685 RepID=UPI00262D2F05|nr:FAD-dependent oxidoreductase [uncultured Paracoccus sp.]
MAGSPPHAGKSFWLQDYGAYQPNADLARDLYCDVLVIGGGIAGLSAAWHAAKSSSGRVVLIESEVIGFGASGRAAGWIMPQFGMDQVAIRKTYGDERAKAAFAYCLRAMNYTRETIAAQGLDSDYRHPGLMRVAFDDRWIGELEALHAMLEDFGVPDLRWLEGAEVQAAFAGNRNFRAASLDPNLGLLNPLKHVRSLKKLAASAGVEIFENTPALHLERRTGGVHVATPRGSVRASKLVVATNAFTHLLEGPLGREMRHLQSPVFARGAVTERLSPQQWSEIGWERGNAIESTLDLFHYMAPTRDGRIQFYWIYHGGHSRFGEMEPAASAEGAAASLDHLKRIFPRLRGVRLAHHWGGHMSGTCDLVPHLTTLGDDRVIYIGGCWGHGLAMSLLHGQTVADMLNDTRSELTDFWIVNRKPKPWPVRPFDHLGKGFHWHRLKRKALRRMAGSIFDDARPRGRGEQG